MFEKRIAKRLFDGVERVLLAVSGGADSVAMAHALASLKQQGVLSCEFVIGHINHCLRGADSDADQAFVKDLAQVLGVPVVTESVDVAAYAKANKLSIETAGRMLRQQALAKMADAHGCSRIATAHHADDQAETLVHRLMRGTGFRGLCGIRSTSIVNSAVYVRPMLNIRRDEIIEYCKTNHIKWRQDKSNTDLQFTRNRIRHQLLPALHAEGDLTDTLTQLSTAAQHLQNRVDRIVKDSLNKLGVEEQKGQITLDRDKLNTCCPLAFYEIIRQGVVLCDAGLRDYSKQNFEKIRQMMTQPKAKADFPGGIEVVVEDDTVLIQRKGYKSSKPKQDASVLLLGDETVQFGSWQITSRFFKADEVDVDRFLESKDASVEWFDAEKVTGPIIIRPRQDGDRFCPIGSTSTKKVARFLQDGQFDAQTRRNAFVITDAENILWLAPIRMSEQVKVTPETTEILEIRVHHQSDRTE
ncbi:MAG: tRNA lysidine(34) synthetase TilS [Planctomycetota bacterium]|jgi:tRNA(Ile)-lysidine synthase